MNPDGQAGTGGGGGGSLPDAAGDAVSPDGPPLADALMGGEAGACQSGLPETGAIVIPMCGSGMSPGGGAPIPDGRYELVAVSVLGLSCNPDEFPPVMSRTLTVSGMSLAGVDGTADASGKITGWSHWRANVTYGGNRMVVQFTCGTSAIANDYRVLPDGGLILFTSFKQSGHAWRFKKI
jgi:hypothetical protein